MISSRELHLRLKSKLNRLNREYSNQVPVYQGDRALTEAYHLWYTSRCNLAETSDEARRDLKDFEIKGESFEVTPKNGNYLMKFPGNYYKHLRLSCIALKPECGEKELSVHVEQSQKLNNLLKNPFWEPSYEYEETIADEYRDGMLIYTKNFEVLRVFMDYFMKPENIQTPSLTKDKYYEGADGKISSDKGLPLTTSLEADRIVDMAALIIMRDKGDLTDYQTQMSKINIIQSN